MDVKEEAFEHECRRVLAAQRAYIETGLNAKLDQRKDVLRRLERLLVNEKEALCDALYRDLRRTAPHTEIMELNLSLQEVRYCLANLDDWAQPEYVERTTAQILDTPMIVRDPFGCCLLIAPWNYPLIMVFLPLATMLAAGNTVVIKPSEVSSNVAEALKDAFAKYFSPKEISVILADAEGTKYLLSQRFDLILYTGSAHVGKEVMKAAAQHITPVVLELGGKCPVIIDNNVDIPSTAKRLAWGKFMNNGQTCIAPDYVLTTSSVKNQLLSELRTTLHQFYGDVEKSKDYSRIINERHFDRLNSLLENTKGEIVIQNAECNREDLFIPPTVVECDGDDILMQDEIFGPILPIVTVNDFDDAIQFLAAKEKPLAMYVFTRSEEKVQKVLDGTRSGALTVNDVVLHMNVDTLPFGGVGHSGFGYYRGRFGFETFTHKRSVLKRPFFGEQLGAARYPPLTPAKLSALRLLGERRALPKYVQRLAANYDIFLLGIVLLLIAQFLRSVVAV